LRKEGERRGIDYTIGLIRSNCFVLRAKQLSNEKSGF